MILRTGDELQPDIEVPNQSEKERFIIDDSRIRALETSTDTRVDFYTANVVKHGIDSFSVRSDFGSFPPTERQRSPFVQSRTFAKRRAQNELKVLSSFVP